MILPSPAQLDGYMGRPNTEALPGLRDSVQALSDMLPVSCQFVGSCKTCYQVMASQVVCQAHKIAPFEAPGECEETQSDYSKEESWRFLLCVISSAAEWMLVTTCWNYFWILGGCHAIRAQERRARAEKNPGLSKAVRRKNLSASQDLDGLR